MFDHMDGVSRAFATKQTQWKEDLYLSMTLVRLRLPNNHAERTPTMGKLLMSACIIDPVRKLWSCRKWDNAMDIHADDKTSYTTQYHDTFLKYVENAYTVKHGLVLITQPGSVLSNNLIPSATASGSGQTCLDPYDLSSNDEEYMMPNNVVATTPGLSDHPAPLSTAPRLSVNSEPQSPENWGQVNPNVNDCHSDTMEISSTCWIPDITN